MRENRQSGSEGREARKRAFLTPIGILHMWHDPEGPSPDGPGMYRCIKLDRDGCFHMKRRSPSRSVMTQALRVERRIFDFATS
jgi:hypothetical protein